jgi:Rieske Fe-S protein
MGVMTKATHAVFKTRMAWSLPAVWLMAQYLCEQWGLTVMIRQTKVAKTWQEHKRFSDLGDIIIVNNEQQTQTVCEVKRLMEKNDASNFTSALTWPEHYHGYMVDSCKSFDGKGKKPSLYFTVNASMTHYGCVIVSDTQEFWTIKKKLDKEQNIDKPYYYCPLHLVKFGEILHGLKQEAPQKES